MQIGEQGLSAAQLFAFRELRLLDLHDEIHAREDVLGLRSDDGTSCPVVRVLEANARPGAALHQDLVSGVDELTHARGHQADPIFVNLDLFGDADFHEIAPWPPSGGWRLDYPSPSLETCKNWSK